MDARQFLSILFAAAPAGAQIELRAPGRFQYFTNPLDPLMRGDMVDPPVDVYFGVCLRRAHGVVEGATVVWCDADKKVPERWHPEPSVTVASSGPLKAHAYWALNKVIPASDAVRLTKLATIAYDGDVKVCESQRVMRLPGTWNVKYTPPRMCEVSGGDGVQYDPELLEEHLVAAIMVDYWEDGNRHQLAMALAALLCRAGWPVERAERCCRSVMAQTGDEDDRDRLAAIRGTFERVSAGEFISAAELKDSMDKKVHRRFVEALGVTAKDGDLLLDGEKIGITHTVQRDLADYFAASRDWAAADGALAHWNGTIWQRGHTESLVSEIFQVLGRLREVVQGIECEFQPTASLAKAVRDVVMGRLMQDDLPLPDAEMLPLRNGVLDLRTLELQPHAREHRARWLLPVDYIPGAEAPEWERFLEEAAPNESAFLQEWFGYSLVNGNPWQRMLWLFGPSNTGKSTFLNAMSDMFGEACVPIKSGNIDDYGVASLAPARVAVCSELSARLLKTDRLKALVASDPMVGRHPYGRPFSVAFQGKFVWASNGLPPVDQAEGLWRRIVVVPFVKVPKKVDPLIGQKIKAELPGILNWAITGLGRMREYTKIRQWDLPLTVIETVEEYREAADTFAAFAREELVQDPEGEIPARELYARYQGWAKARGYQPEPFGPVFWRELKKVGLEPDSQPKMVKGRLVRMWRGANLAPEVFG